MARDLIHYPAIQFCTITFFFLCLNVNHPLLCFLREYCPVTSTHFWSPLRICLEHEWEACLIDVGHKTSLNLHEHLFFFLSLHFLKRHCVRSGIFCDSVALQYMYMYTCFWLWLHYLWGGMVVQWLAPGIDSHSAAFLHQHPLRLCHDVCRIIMNPPRFS